MKRTKGGTENKWERKTRAIPEPERKDHNDENFIRTLLKAQGTNKGGGGKE